MSLYNSNIYNTDQCKTESTFSSLRTTATGDLYCRPYWIFNQEKDGSPSYNEYIFTTNSDFFIKLHLKILQNVSLIFHFLLFNKTYGQTNSHNITIMKMATRHSRRVRRTPAQSSTPCQQRLFWPINIHCPNKITQTTVFFSRNMYNYIHRASPIGLITWRIAYNRFSVKWVKSTAQNTNPHRR